MNRSSFVSASAVASRGLQFAVSPADTLIPGDIREKYDVVETRHAAAILVHDLHEEWNDIVSVLREFSLLRSDVTAGGGNRSTISAKFDQAFRQRVWPRPRDRPCRANNRNGRRNRSRFPDSSSNWPPRM